MKLIDLSLRFKRELASYYNEDEAMAIFLIAIEHHLKLNRSSYALKKEDELVDADLQKIDAVLELLITLKPIQYILGETFFYGLTLKVNEAVLIPRPETEELVDWVLQEVKASFAINQSISILDIGTGSGCIAISLKKNLPNALVNAIDISAEALAIAKHNALLNGVEVNFIEQDILDNSVSLPNTQYSLLISNPPYITQTEKAEMHENVLAYEPHLALFVSNEKPLIFYEAIADFALRHLENEGLLFFEINEYLGKEMVNMLEDKGFKNIVLKKDMQGKDRMVCCSLVRG